MSPAERSRYSCVEWADEEVRKARAKGHEPNSTYPLHPIERVERRAHTRECARTGGSPRC
jgi:hypothetical protein